MDMALADSQLRADSAVLDLQGIAKCYRIYDKPHHRLLQALFPRKPYSREFWALSEVSLSVQRGETLGILGRNGSGKSTLLQIAAGTLRPTRGAVTTRGRVAALLELGAGFNPEFSGRENALLNATILGFTTEQIEERLPGIVAFSALGEFIERPVKTYSSGMYARLAFAVAISVEPDVLIIDEALSVGDAGFQLKCLLKMRELQDAGTTIVFCSHDTSSILRLCERAVVLDKGRMVANDRDVLRCCKLYDRLSRNAAFAGAPAVPHVAPVDRDYASELGGIEETRFGSGEAKYLDVEFCSEAGVPAAAFNSGETIEIRATIAAARSFPAVVNGFTLKDKSGVDVWGDNCLFANTPVSLEKGRNRLTYRFVLNLLPGEYFLYIGLADIESGERIELDQRWPVRKLTVLGVRSQLGYVYAPATIECVALDEG